MAYSSSSGLKSKKKTSDEGEDCPSSWAVKGPNCLAFVACPGNYGKKQQIKVMSVNYPSSTSCSERSGSPPPKRDPGNHQSVDPREPEPECEKREHSSKKRRAREGNPNSGVHALWLG